MAGSSPAKGSSVVYGSLKTTDCPQPDSHGLGPAIHALLPLVGVCGEDVGPGQARPRGATVVQMAPILRTARSKIFPGQPCGRAGGEGKVGDLLREIFCRSLRKIVPGLSFPPDSPAYRGRGETKPSAVGG